jgi:hypothetical protein
LEADRFVATNHASSFHELASWSDWRQPVV